MSTTTFVEATSADPFVRGLHRQAVRVLNDPTLDRQQREMHVRRLQSILRAHLTKEATKASQLAQKKAKREQVSRANRNQGMADQSQVLARRREFVSVPLVSPLFEQQKAPCALIDADQQPVTGRSRPVLRLKKA
jgi:hypothetical protein